MTQGYSGAQALRRNKHRVTFWSIAAVVAKKASKPAAHLLRRYAPTIRDDLQPTLYAFYAWLSWKQTRLLSLDDFSVEDPPIEQPGPKPRLLIDVTTTYHMSNVTGIQRTVRSLSSALQRNSTRYTFDALPVCLKRTPDAKLVLMAVPGFPDSNSREQNVSLRAGDCFFMLDSSWDIYPKWAEAMFPRIRGLGGKVFTCVYDILPITNPEFFTSATVEMFRSWFKSAMRDSDVLFAISETTRLQLEQMPGERRPHTEFFHLGADSLPIPTFSSSQARSKGRTFLMVGTIEPRKGHSTVLEAFEKLWSSHPEIRLIFVGREGWKVSTLVSKMEKLRSTNSSFLYYRNASDELLAKCYDEADAVIAASLAEGFGLPLVETMLRGKPLIASDIPAFREIAGDFPTYFRPADPSSLAEAIRSFLSSGPRTLQEGPQWISWDESSDQLMSKIDRYCGFAAVSD